YELEIITKSNKTVFKGKLDNTKFIELDISLGIVYINYYKYDQKKPFFKEELDLKNRCTQPLRDKTKLEYLIERVQHHMDNPEGSIEEIEYHTLMIKKSSYDRKARQYV